MKTRDEEHSARFTKMLKGKRIDSCRYMTIDEADQFGWYARPLIIVFSDKSYIILQSDDEGNDGGAALYEHKPSEDKHSIIYTI